MIFGKDTRQTTDVQSLKPSAFRVASDFGSLASDGK